MEMKNLIILLSLVFMLSLQACFVPVNSVYDTARMLDKKESSAGLNYSRYYAVDFDIFDDDENGMVNYNNNFGLAFRYGLSEKLNMSVRYEYLYTRSEIEFLGETFSDNMNYLELGLKMRLIEDKLALGLPLGMYLYEEAFSAALHPRLFYTIRKNDKFDFTITPNVLLLIGDGVQIIPGLCLGVGFSNNLNKWAIRPEIGYNTSFCFGIGTYFNFLKVD